ncbi:MAG: hypothetical protein PHT49_11820 [Desulfovibrionales bacterium]|nr:hypothetical protein [Desulfovibrionales bacterium]
MTGKTAKETAVKAQAAKAPASKREAPGIARIRNEAIKKAKAFNIPMERLTLSDLIKTVQLTEGNFDCFGSATAYCDQNACSWRAVCFTTASQHL